MLYCGCLSVYPILHYWASVVEFGGAGFAGGKILFEGYYDYVEVRGKTRARLMTFRISFDEERD